MIHPDIVLKKSKISGRGLFAKKKIPRGTIVWREGQDRIYTLEQFKKFSKKYQKTVERYSYEWKGLIHHPTEIDKYWNHSCAPNTAPSFSARDEMDIAVFDIQKGQELTYDYGLLMGKIDSNLMCRCGQPICRGIIKQINNSSKITKNLAILAKNAEEFTPKIRQPLLSPSEMGRFSH